MNELNILVNYKKDFWPIAIALLVLFSSITGFFLLNQLYYYIAVAACGIIIFKKGGVRLGNVSVLLLIIACIISLLFNNVPSFFRAWQRLGVYIFILFMISPLLISKDAVILKSKLFIYIWLISSILSIGSFFCYYLGINLFIVNGTELALGAGTFGGLMNHSMALGPSSALSTIFLFVLALLNKTQAKRYYYIAALLSLGACFLSASRAAVGASVVGCIFALASINKNNLSRSFKVLFVIVSIAAITFPIWGGVTDLVMQKQEINKEMGGTMASREEKYAARIEEFESSPIWGIGYCTINPQLDNVNRENGQIEPGSSWLAIASMTGILGLMVMIPLCISSLKKARRIKDDFWRGVLSGMLVFYILHMAVEGYIFAPKSYLSLLFWLLLSVIDGCTLLEKNIVINKTSKKLSIINSRINANPITNKCC